MTAQPEASDFMTLDTRINRSNTGSKKWDLYQGRDIIPMGLADMDFPAPAPVLAAMRHRLAHGVLGYTNVPASLVQAARQHLRSSYGWDVQENWLVWLPGVVAGLNLACRSAGKTGDAVIVMPPVYPPFLRAPALAEREAIVAPLAESADGWSIDWALLRNAVTPQTRMLLLCHPHNPIGKVWSPQELAALADFACAHDLLVCSDEIHCDLQLNPETLHRPFASIAQHCMDRTITLMSPSKTWNLPGVACAFAVIPDSVLRARFMSEMRGLVPSAGTLAYVAAEAAYRDGAPWLAQVMEILRTNRRLLVDFFEESPLKLTIPQATYLAWIDARSVDHAFPLSVFESHGVGLSDGRDFGSPGWLRLNFGCPTGTLMEALRRLQPLCLRT